MQTLMRARLLAPLLAAAAALTSCASDEQPTQSFSTLEGALSASVPQPYIVQFAAGLDVDATAKELAGTFGLAVRHRFHHALRGAAVQVPGPILAKLAADPRVAQIDYDFDVYAIGKPGPAPTPVQTVPIGYTYIGAGETANEGAGGYVAVLDTGIDLDHPDLAANLDASAALLKDCVGENTTPGNDLDGHGSHVAGTVAAVDNTIGSIGIGTALKVVPVKVLNRNGKGSWSTIVCGIDHVTAHASVLRVANLSLGGPGSYCAPDAGCTPSALQMAIENSVKAGVTYAVAAGNEGALASTSVPAAYPAVIAVSAYDTKTSTFPSWSNYGPRVDIAAPGVGIFSTTKNGGYATFSGTSMAAPHVAAAAALYLVGHPTASPAQVRQGVLQLALPSYPGQNAQHGEPILQVHEL